MSRPPIRDRQTAKLRDLLTTIHPRNPFWRARIEAARFPIAAVSRMDLGEILASLPLVTKSELEADQAAHPPYGTDLTEPLVAYCRHHQTSGTSGGAPLRWLDTEASWGWFVCCWKEVFAGARVAPPDRVLVPFSFGPFIGFWGAFEAAAALGCFTLPGGGLSTAARLQAIADHSISVVTATPTYALRMAEAAQAAGIDLAGSSVRALIVAGEPGGGIPETRRALESAWGARVFDHAGMTEIGCYAYEDIDDPGNMRVIEEEFIVEVLAPDGATPVASGEIGELVLTNLGRVGAPLLRYRTGDLVRYERAEAPGERGRLLGGILARADDMVFIRGNNVYPAAIEGLIRRFPEVAEYRAVVVESALPTELRLELELSAGLTAAQPGVASRKPHLGDARSARLVRNVEDAFRERLHFRPDVRVVPAGSLPRFELKARRFFRERVGGSGSP